MTDVANSEPIMKKSKVDARSPSTIPSHIQWVNIYADNNKQTADFYERLLGWKAEYTENSEHWLELKGKNPKVTNIAFHALDKVSPDKAHKVKAGTVALNMIVKDLVGFHEQVKDLEGVKVIMEPTRQFWGGFMADYVAPDGTEIALLEETSITCHDAEAVKSSEEPVKEKQAEVKEKVEEEVKQEKPANTNGSGICHFDIPCADQARITKFLVDTFGWTFKLCGTYSFFTSNDPKHPLAGGLVVTEERIKGGFVHLNVNDIAAACEKVKENGGTIVKEKYMIDPSFPDMYGAKIADTEGNVWSLFKNEAHAKHTK